MSFEPVVCEIAGILALISCETRAMADAAAEGRGPFLAAGSDRTTDIRLRARLAPVEAGDPGDAVFVSGALWTLHRRGPEYSFMFTSDVYGDAPYKSLVVDESFTSGEILLNRDYFGPSDSVDPLQYPADELLWIHHLARNGGVEVHASGVVDANGDGYLFLGHSGDGKSTMARQWESVGATVLSDDRIVVRHTDDGFRMYGTPWHGEAELSAASEASLRGIFFVGHGSSNKLSELSVPDSAVRFFARCFPAFHDAESIGASLAFYERLAGSTPCFDLRFVPGEEIVDFVRAANGVLV